MGTATAAGRRIPAWSSPPPSAPSSSTVAGTSLATCGRITLAGHAGSGEASWGLLRRQVMPGDGKLHLGRYGPKARRARYRIHAALPDARGPDSLCVELSSPRPADKLRVHHPARPGSIARTCSAAPSAFSQMLAHRRSSRGKKSKARSTKKKKKKKKKKKS